MNTHKKIDFLFIYFTFPRTNFPAQYFLQLNGAEDSSVCCNLLCHHFMLEMWTSPQLARIKMKENEMDSLYRTI